MVLQTLADASEPLFNGTLAALTGLRWNSGVFSSLKRTGLIEDHPFKLTDAGRAAPPIRENAMINDRHELEKLQRKSSPSAQTVTAEGQLARLHAYVLHHYGTAARTGKSMDNFERDLASQVATLTASLAAASARIGELEKATTKRWNALVLVDAWWESLPPALRQDIEGSGNIPGCIAHVKAALSQTEEGR